MLREINKIILLCVLKKGDYTTKDVCIALSLFNSMLKCCWEIRSEVEGLTLLTTLMDTHLFQKFCTHDSFGEVAYFTVRRLSLDVGIKQGNLVVEKPEDKILVASINLQSKEDNKCKFKTQAL